MVNDLTVTDFIYNTTEYAALRYEGSKSKQGGKLRLTIFCSEKENITFIIDRFRLNKSLCGVDMSNVKISESPLTFQRHKDFSLTKTNQ